MLFINPKIDFAFKKIFGSEDSKDILISFLNALIYEEQPVIQDLEILKPYLAPKIRGVKDTYLDIKARIIDENHNAGSVIIEIQVLNVEGFKKQILYNAAKSYSTQLTTRQNYNLLLNPVIVLTITDFVMFPDLDKVLSKFVLKEKDYLIDYPIYDIELIFVELPKFKKELPELRLMIDKWLYFLTQARSLLQVPEVMGEIPEIKKAFDIANQENFTLNELKDQEKSEILIQEQRGAVTKGIQQGIEQGTQQTTEKMAKKMLNLIDDQTICQITGLSLAALESLKDTSL